MGLTKNIKKLVAYGIGARLIQPEDEIFMINQYLDLFGLDEYDDPDIDDEKIVLVDILNALTDEAFEKGIIQSDDIVTRDLFDTKLMGIMTPVDIKTSLLMHRYDTVSLLLFLLFYIPLYTLLSSWIFKHSPFIFITSLYHNAASFGILSCFFKLSRII